MVVISDVFVDPSVQFRFFLIISIENIESINLQRPSSGLYIIIIFLCQNANLLLALNFCPITEVQQLQVRREYLVPVCWLNIEYSIREVGFPTQPKLCKVHVGSWLTPPRDQNWDFKSDVKSYLISPNTS